jgi:hypothetical protein
MSEGYWLRPDPAGAVGQPGEGHGAPPMTYMTVTHCAEVGGAEMVQSMVQLSPEMMAAGQTSH